MRWYEDRVKNPSRAQPALAPDPVPAIVADAAPDAGGDVDGDGDVDVDVDGDGDGDGDVELPPPPPARPLLAGVLRLVVPDAAGQQRLDAWLAAELQLSRSRANALIDAGAITVDGVRPKRASYKLSVGEQIVVTTPPSWSAPAPLPPMVAEDLPLVVIYDDDDICVIDKPAGMVVHPGAGHDTGTVANALMFRFPGLSVGGERRPGIVHRLDKDTSGLLVVAKHDEALRHLAAQFAAHNSDSGVDKRYIACCFGLPGPPGVEVELITGHDRAVRDRRRFTTRLDPPEEGVTIGQLRLAHTCFTVRHAAATLAVVDVRLLTGRTHQIRAHLADSGHPLLQDDLYGGVHIERRLQNGPVRDAVVQLRRQALHASSLSFIHPRTGQRVSFSSPLPADMAAVVDAIALLAQTDSRA
jgi:23S rRNA pseudouridine1911/1915/1917 synthase